jgi:hypothetical protein
MPVIEDAEHWRAQAIEARALAELLTGPEAKRLMLGVGVDCEKRAVWEEDRRDRHVSSRGARQMCASIPRLRP